MRPGLSVKPPAPTEADPSCCASCADRRRLGLRLEEAERALAEENVRLIESMTRLLQADAERELKAILAEVERRAVTALLLRKTAARLLTVLPPPHILRVTEEKA